MGSGHLDQASITQMLNRWKQGDRSVDNALANAIYPMLRQIARSQARRNAGVLTLAATELAHEAYERLQEQRAVDWQNREHFYAIAATAIRRVVVDYLRQRSAEKRGGDLVRVDLDDVAPQELATKTGEVDWLALDQAMVELEKQDAVCARVAELKLFSGLSTDAIASVCETSVATVGRQWRFARTWLADQLAD